MSAIMSTPMIAVTTSTKKIATSDALAYSAPATAGARSAMPAWMEPLMPLTRMSRSLGVICGTSAETAGIWMPAPTERIASVR